jgi:hypothetical protein
MQVGALPQVSEFTNLVNIGPTEVLDFSSAAQASDSLSAVSGSYGCAAPNAPLRIAVGEWLRVEGNLDFTVSLLYLDDSQVGIGLDYWASGGMFKTAQGGFTSRGLNVWQTVNFELDDAVFTGELGDLEVTATGGTVCLGKIWVALPECDWVSETSDGMCQHGGVCSYGTCSCVEGEGVDARCLPYSNSTTMSPSRSAGAALVVGGFLSVLVVCVTMLV